MGLPEPRAETTIPWISAIFVLATIFFGVRVYFEYRRWRVGMLTKARIISFWLAAGAWLCMALAYALLMWTLAIIIQQRHTGNALDELLRKAGISIYLSTLPMYMRLLYSTVLLLATGMWLVKGSFVAMYFDISSRLSKTLRLSLYVVAAYVVFSYLVVFVSLFIWCDNFGEVFHMERYLLKMDQYCNPINYVNGTSNLDLYTVMNTTSDFVVMVIPLLILRTIQTSKREKWAVIFLLGLGALTIVTTAVRTELMAASSSWGKSRFQTGQILAMAECAAAVIAVSLPSMRAAWNIRKATQKSSNQQSGGMSGGMSGGRSRSASNPMMLQRDQPATEYIEMDRAEQGGALPYRTAETIVVGQQRSPSVAEKIRLWKHSR